MADRVKETSETARLARQAVELGKEDAVALSTGAFALAFVCGDLDDGAACIDRALALNPNLAAAWSVSGRVRIYLGEHQLAFEHLVHSMRLSPRDSLMFLAQNGIAFVHRRISRRSRSWNRRPRCCAHR